jgi:hypothetical protein
MLSYVGPETMMPAASVIATAVGLFLIGWRFVLVVAARFLRLVLRTTMRPAADASVASLSARVSAWPLAMVPSAGDDPDVAAEPDQAPLQRAA